MENKLFSPTNFPEFEELFGELLDSLLKESARGAVLIGTARVEDYLAKFIESILPFDSNSYKKKLFKYPGPLSSFSAKTELAFAFRLIDKNLYDSLNALRKIRNDAAHSSESFSFKDIKFDMQTVFDLGPSMPVFIQNLATQLMVKFHIEKLESLFKEHDFSLESKQDFVENLMKNPEHFEKLEEQLPHWELTYGIVFLCGILVYDKFNTLEALGKNRTWSGLLKNNNNG